MLPCLFLLLRLWQTQCLMGLCHRTGPRRARRPRAPPPCRRHRYGRSRGRAGTAGIADAVPVRRRGRLPTMSTRTRRRGREGTPRPPFPPCPTASTCPWPASGTATAPRRGNVSRRRRSRPRSCGRPPDLLPRNVRGLRYLDMYSSRSPRRAARTGGGQGRVKQFRIFVRFHSSSLVLW